MSQATITLLLLCVAAFAAGVLSKTKSKLTNSLLVVLPLATILTISLVSSREHIPFQDAFTNLLAFNAHAAKASLGLYAALVLFCFCVGAAMRKVSRSAT
jgi:hypothetical protein